MADAFLLVNTPNADARKAYDAAWERLNATGARHPQGRLSHTAWLVGDVLHVLDVWESEDDLNRFIQSTLGSLFDEFGMKLDGPPVKGELLQIVTPGDAAD